MGAAGPAAGGDRGLAGTAGGRRQARLAPGDRRCLAGGREKGGDQVGRTQRGRPGSRYPLAVDARGAPLEVRLAPGNENERRHLLPLVDALAARGIRPEQVWADRGYDSSALAEALRERQIEPCISKRRRGREPVAPGQATHEDWRGKKRHAKTRDPQA